MGREPATSGHRASLARGRHASRACRRPAAARPPGTSNVPAPAAPARTPAARRLACSLALCAGAAAQAPAQPAYVDAAARFAFTPPAGWRTLTPDEGRTLRGRQGPPLPAELLEPQPPRLLVFGPIDRWLDGAFDGRALTVIQQDGEPGLDAAALAGIRAHFASLSARGGERYVVEKLEVGAVGAAAHPAVLSEVRIESEGAAARARFDAYVPSGGVTLIFALAWPVADRGAGATAFADLCASLQVGAKPRGSAKLGSKLLWAAVLGLGIGVVLHTLRKRPTG